MFVDDYVGIYCYIDCQYDIGDIRQCKDCIVGSQCIEDEEDVQDQCQDGNDIIIVVVGDYEEQYEDKVNCQGNCIVVDIFFIQGRFNQGFLNDFCICRKFIDLQDISKVFVFLNIEVICDLRVIGQDRIDNMWCRYYFIVQYNCNFVVVILCSFCCQLFLDFSVGIVYFQGYGYFIGLRVRVGICIYYVVVSYCCFVIL